MSDEGEELVVVTIDEGEGELEETEKAQENIEAEAEEEDASSSSEGERNQKKLKRMRCPVCHKKLTVVNSYECRCGLSFCSAHRYAETHNCTFDYKEEGKRVLSKANPVIVAPKVEKI